jgi:hypothetical protein
MTQQHIVNVPSCLNSKFSPESLKSYFLKSIDDVKQFHCYNSKSSSSLSFSVNISFC